MLQRNVGMSPAAFSSNVDAKGSVQFPDNFRMTMVHLGSWFVPEGDASGFHDVYAARGKRRGVPEDWQVS